MAVSWIIRPGIGLGDLCFGALQDDVRAYLGRPDEDSEELIADDPCVTWYYWDLGVTAHFNGEDAFRLGTLSVERQDAELFGLRLIGAKEQDVRTIVDMLELGESTHEVMHFSDHPTLHQLSYPDHSLNLWFKHDRLESIQWNYLIGPDDEVVWPAHS